MPKSLIFPLFLLFFFVSCSPPKGNGHTPRIGFLDAFQDETISEAKRGFLKALSEEGFDEKKKTLEVIYKNAQGSIPTMNLEVNYLLDQNLRLLATNTTLSTISTAQRTQTLPLFMMVSPSPKMAGLVNKTGNPPPNLFGVYENLDYIDTSLILLKLLRPSVKRLGAIYSQGETQSAEAFQHLKDRCQLLHIELLALPVNNSSETQLVVQSLVNKSIDAFFALPDNSVFSSFETILKTCKQGNIPIFTSEEGLVKRGALAAFGADIFEWGHQAGMSAALYLKTGSVKNLKPELVRVRRKVYNARVAAQFHIFIPPGISPVKE